MMVFKILDIRQQRTVIPERWKINTVRPTTTAPAYHLEKFSRLRYREEEPRHNSTTSYAEEMKLRVCGDQRSQNLQIRVVSEAEEAAGRQRAPEICGESPLEYSAEYTDQFMSEKNNRPGIVLVLTR